MVSFGAIGDELQAPPRERGSAQAVATAMRKRRSIERPVRWTDLVLYEIDGEGIVFDPATGNTHRLNATALEIWRLCDGRRTPTDIAETLADRYDVSFAEAAGHVDDAVQLLEGRGLLLRQLASQTAENALEVVVG